MCGSKCCLAHGGCSQCKAAVTKDGDGDGDGSGGRRSVFVFVFDYKLNLLLNSKFNLVTWCQSFNGLEQIVAEVIHATVTFFTESMAFKMSIHYCR